jgi:hypothetical protein
VWFPLDALSSQAGIRKPGGFDLRIGSRSKSQAKIQTAARRESSEDSMKKAFLLIVVPALLVALGFAQTPAASINPDQTIKGCLGGSDGNYTVVEDGTGHILKITSSSVDFKQHLGHEVTLIGHRASGASSAAADKSFAVTELNMISEHCAAAAAAPTATVITPAETTVIPDAAAVAAAATTIAPAETAVTPGADATAPAATVITPETIVIPDAAAAAAAPTIVTPPDTVVTPDADTTAPAAAVITPGDNPAVDAADSTRPPVATRRLPATSAAVAATPAVTASTSSETASTPDAAAATPAAPASTPSETASTPDAAATTPAAPARHGGLWLLISLGVLVIVLGTLVPFLSRWKKRKALERTDAPNLSFTREASSDSEQEKPEQPRKAA